jgi:SAM-dependent methyltransferase
MDTLALQDRVARSVDVACPSCGGTSTEPLYEVRSIPLHSCILLDTEDAARGFPRRNLELVLCPDCGFAFNAIFDDPAMAYAVNFEESQHFSETFNAFASELVDDVVRTCGASGKRILEIGCGKGEFLDRLCRAAQATGVGIDPAYRADPGRTSGENGVRFLPERFGCAHYGLPVDIVICRHTLEHIASVREFVVTIAEMIGARDDAWVMFETPDFARVLEEGAFWDIYYEHCSYFSAGTHADLFERAGFAVERSELLYGSQYIVQYARPIVGGSGRATPDADAVAEMRRLARVFPEKVRQKQAFWRNKICDAHAAGRNVALWGGGSKAVSLVTTLGLGAEVKAVVDINPFKQGRFLPGTGHRVIAPEALSGYDPDLIVVMNPLYRDEVCRSLGDLGISAEVIALS